MFHNRPRRRKFRSNGKSFRRRFNGEHQRKNNSGLFTNSQIRTSPFKGVQSPHKLIEKYNNLAKEALSSGDRILSENYLQHADHFSRIIVANNSRREENNVETSQVEVKEDEMINANKEEDQLTKNLDKKTESK